MLDGGAMEMAMAMAIGDAANEEQDEPGNYSRRDIYTSRKLQDFPFVYTDECRLIQRAFYICDIPNQLHSNIFILAGVTTFAKLAAHTNS